MGLITYSELAQKLQGGITKDELEEEVISTYYESFDVYDLLYILDQVLVKGEVSEYYDGMN